MNQIFVTGHRNPDTDSIVSAMAYTALRNALGDREYVAARLGHLSDETKKILNRFGFEPPVQIKNMRTQVMDLDYDTPPLLNQGVTVNRAWRAMENQEATIPLTNDEGGLAGMLSFSDMAAHSMKSSVANPRVEDVPLFNLLSVLEGQLIYEPKEMVESLSGEVVIALPQAGGSVPFANPDSLVICGQQPDMIRSAMELGVRCIILCQAELPADLLAMAGDTCVISTPLDPYYTARLIFQAIPVSRVCQTQDIHFFHLTDYLDDVQEVVLKSRRRSYPILDENDKVVGTLSRFHLLRPRRKRVVLVDHNEAAQSVPGLSQADIVAIIDHHRLADIQTRNPIYVRNEPVGSTTTIVATMFQERGLMPPEKLAGLMASAIITDTVMFKSPTCTDRDRAMAERLARLAHISLDELGEFIFSSSSELKPAEELLFSDFKEFHLAGNYFAIGQITCTDSTRQLEQKAEFLQLMQQAKSEKGYNLVILMLTDVLLEGTKLLCIGDEETVEQAFNVRLKEQEAFLPGVISRKKQVVPMLSALWG